MRAFLERFDLRVSVGYGLIATLWVVLSDGLLASIFAGTPSLLAVVGALKGLGFVGVTMLALFAVLRIEFRKRERMECALKNDITEHTQTLEALRQSESRFATLFHASPAPTGISRLEDGHIVDVNDAFVKLLGYECTELFGHTALELGLWVYPEGRSDFVEAISERGSVHNLELQGRTKSGATISLLGSAQLIDLGDVPYIVSLFYDITERKQMENQIRYQALLLANASDAVISTDMNFNIQSWNPAAERIYGWKAEEVMGKPIQKITRSEYFDTTEKDTLRQLQTAGTWRGETAHRCKDGSQVYLLASTSYVTDGVGNRVGVVSVNKDISERKQAENELTRYQNDLEQLVEQRTAELKRAKMRLEATLNNTSDGIVLAYPDRGVDQSNSMFNTLFGCEPDHFCNQTLLMLVNPDDRDRLAALIQAVTADGVNRQGEFLALRADNTLFEARIGLGSIQDSDAIGAGLVCSIQNISELKQRERLLRYHASLQENVSDAVIATDLKFRIQSWNLAAEQIYGWRAEEVLGKSIGEVLPTEFASDETGEQIQTDFVEKGCWSDEVVQYHKDGRALHILSSTVLFKDENRQPFGIVAVNHDITAHKAAELIRQAKAQEERAFQSALKELHEISLELTPLDTLDAFYQRVVELGLSRLGFERLALFLYDAPAGCAQGTYGTDQHGQIHDEHALRLTPNPQGIMIRALERAERFCLDEPVPLLYDTKPMGLGWNAAAALWSGSRMIGWLVADNLIEQKPASKALMEIFALYALTVGALLGQKQAVTALRESEEKFRLFVESAPEAIVICNRQGTITLVNAEAEHIFGYHRAELIGQAVELLVPEVQREVHQRHRDRYAAAPSRRSGEALPEFPARRKDGSQFPAEIQLSAVQTLDDLLVISFIADISERKRAEEALQRALEQQKELVDLKSRFISMASHDFRNPMSVILSSIALLELQISRQFGVEQLEPLQKRLRRIDESVRQMTSLLDDVLTVSRADAGKVEVHAELLDVERLGEEFLQEIQLTAGTQHLLKFSFVGQESSIVSDPQLLRQILINLLSNAVKYSPKGGDVRLEIHCAPESVEFQVQDKGIGIPMPDQARLFEVFHRAHNVGAIKGTGLGMAIVKRAVDALDGTITFESQLGVGTTFTVQLPSVPDTSSA